jgi:hypothetical protein
LVDKPNRARLLIAIGAIAAIVVAVLIATRSGGGAGGATSTGASDPGRGDSPSARADQRRTPERVRPGRQVIDVIEPGIPVVVEGRVLDAQTGAPQPGLDVELTAAGGPALEVIATSDGDGRYRAEILSGRWQVTVRAERAWSAPVLLAVGAPADGVVVHDVLVDRASVVRGRVVRAGAAVAGAQVSAGGEVSATTDRAGRFELVVPPGEARLRAEADGAVGFAAVDALAPGAEVTVDIAIPEPASIAGRVVDDGGAVIAGATVLAVIHDVDGGGDPRAEAVTDAAGRFHLAAIPPGKVVLEARLAGRGSSGPARVVVAAGERRHDVTLALGATVAIGGVVVEPSGDPVDGARVRITLKGTRSPLAVLTTGGDGRFHVADAITGVYEIAGSRRDRVARTQVDVTADTTVELVLAEPGGIRGAASTTEGAPVRGLSVAIERFVPDGVERAARPKIGSASFAGTGGDFTLPGLPSGRYDLVVTAADHAAARVAGVIVTDGAWAEVAVDLGSGARVSGIVTAGGRPVAGARVAIDGARIDFTDAAGRFALDAAPLGPVTINVTADRRRAAQRGAVVVAGGVEVSIELPDDGARDVEGIGVVLDQLGDAIEVIAVRGGAPARGRVPVGAAIVAVDGQAVAGLHAAVARIRGAAGTAVTLTLAHGGRTWDVTLVRARVKIATSRDTVA